MTKKSETKSHSEEMNSQAYQDVLDRQSPRYPDDSIYLKKYRSWAALLPEEDFH